MSEAVGSVFAHEITEIRQGEFKGPAFRKGHIIREEDICHLQRLGKEHFFVLHIADDEVHEDDAAYELAYAGILHEIVPDLTLRQIITRDPGRVRYQYLSDEGTILDMDTWKITGWSSKNPTEWISQPFKPGKD